MGRRGHDPYPMPPNCDYGAHDAFNVRFRVLVPGDLSGHSWPVTGSGQRLLSRTERAQLVAEFAFHPHRRPSKLVRNASVGFAQPEVKRSVKVVCVVHKRGDFQAHGAVSCALRIAHKPLHEH
jgi:hypothetical protein